MSIHIVSSMASETVSIHPKMWQIIFEEKIVFFKRDSRGKVENIQRNMFVDFPDIN